jgi:hypothetical protein
MIKHIFKQIWAERRQNSWILLELLAVFFFLLMMCDFLWIKVKNYIEPKGFDIENTYILQLKLLIPAAPDYVDPDQNTMTPIDELIQLTDRIKQYPDIESLSFSRHTKPYSLGGFWMGLMVDTVRTGSMRIRQVTPSYFDVFRITSPDGSQFNIDPAGGRQGIITESMALRFFGSVDKACGRDIYVGDEEDAENIARIVAVSANHKMHDLDPYQDTYYDIIHPFELEKLAWNDNITEMEVCVRIRNGASQHFRENFESEMGERLRVNNLYVSSLISSDKLRDDVVGKMLRQDVLLMTYVMIFVLITAFLGIFGSFWLRTSQRKCEIGIRMAMGANKKTIRYSMIAEGLCLLFITIIPAFIVYLNLLNAEVLDVRRLPFTSGRVIVAFLSSLVIIIIIIAGGIYQPASRAASTPPVDALRDE